MEGLESLLVAPADAIRMVMSGIDRSTKGIALVVDGDRKLIGTITDGDVRRAILAGLSLDAPAADLLARKANVYAKPTTARVGTPRAKLLQLMRQKSIRQLPLVDADGRVVDLLTIDELAAEPVPPMQAVIMAGGFGKRLRPLTEDLPKPMLPVGDRPLLQRTIEQLRRSGLKRVSITTHYLSEKIESYFKDGSDFGVELNYLSEEKPLGTAGALALLETPEEPLLVINGDILTGVDFRAMHAYHREHKADLTVAVRQYEVQVPYGVMECAGAVVTTVDEKPRLRFLVNAGIYLLEPLAHKLIPRNQPFDMPDLIRTLIDNGRTVVSYPIVEYWLDIGQLADYERAQEDVRSGRLAS